MDVYLCSLSVMIMSQPPRKLTKITSFFMKANPCSDEKTSIEPENDHTGSSEVPVPHFLGSAVNTTEQLLTT